jgi:hypothetical protein
MSPNKRKKKKKKGGRKNLSYLGLTKVYVGNRVFAVKEVEDGSISDSLGEVLFTLGRIDLAPNQTPDCLADTLLHEVIHVIDFVFGAIGTYLTEEQVVRLTGGLLAVLNDPRNSELLNALMLLPKDDIQKERRV